jgi:hypothetical protein
MPMNEDERALFERITRAQERIADAVENQQPGKAGQVLATAAAIAAVVGVLSIADVVIKWFTGG